MEKCKDCTYIHKDNETCEEVKHRVKLLLEGVDLIKSGYAGVNSKGTIIDRRVEKGVSIQENSLFGTPKPKKIKNDEKL